MAPLASESLWKCAYTILNMDTIHQQVIQLGVVATFTRAAALPLRSGQC